MTSGQIGSDSEIKAGAPPRPRPAHCPDRLDNRRWIKEGSCGEEYHQLIAQATEAARGWLEIISGTLTTAEIGRVRIPSMTGTGWAGGPVIDPSMAYIVIAQARRGSKPADALYLGVVAQTPQVRWRGITGFYLPYCSGCGRDRRSALTGIIDSLPEDAHVVQPDKLPHTIRPAPGWFDDRMTFAVRLGELSEGWEPWQAGMPVPPPGPALVCIGPPSGHLNEVLYLEDASEDLPALSSALQRWRPTGQHPPVLAYRCGSANTLQTLTGGIRSAAPPAGLISRTISTRPSSNAGPIDWGGFICTDGPHGETAGISTDLRHAIRLLRGEAKSQGHHSIETHYWTAGCGVIAFRHLQSLEQLLKASTLEAMNRKLLAPGGET